MNDLSSRLTVRIQLASDDCAHRRMRSKPLSEPMSITGGSLNYDSGPIGPGRYAPPRVTGAERTVIAGSPDQAHISTSLVERQNLTMRMQMRRFTRLTNGFSKKLENLKAAVSLHSSLRVTPAMAAGVSDKLWTLEELVERTSK